MTERLDRIESILLQNTSQIATLLEGQIKLQEAQSKTQQQLDELARDTRSSIEDLIEMVTPLIIQGAENSTFIRGLQVENRRILRELRDSHSDRGTNRRRDS
ncbi:MAG: hypothetical protein LH647_18970 [Leptolyngbyaceae cyanobacterium CAN_BIN12]|nr:hypothetical protein [Leptolyngbyaceae cyanobacterium CAN_BIN12]